LLTQPLELLDVFLQAGTVGTLSDTVLTRFLGEGITHVALTDSLTELKAGTKTTGEAFKEICHD
jgi:hypothetical protein